jgi:hypothetical protein
MRPVVVSRLARFWKVLVVTLLFSALLGRMILAEAQTTTTPTLADTSSTSPAVATQSVVTLTATVTAGATQVHPGW